MIVIHSLLKYELLYFGLTLEILHEQHGKGVLGNIYIYIYNKNKNKNKNKKKKGPKLGGLVEN